MPQQSRVGRVATTVKRKGKTLIVRYHQTDVVKATDKTVVLNTGGWKSVTTKNRMNQASRQYGLGYSVFQEKGVWFVQQGKKVREFKCRTMTLRRKRR